MCTRVSSIPVATQTLPALSTRSVACSPSPIVWMVFRLFFPICEIVPSAEFATQT